MHTSTITSFTNTGGQGWRRSARLLLAEIFYALSLSNRAYYQGLNRF